MQGMTIDTYNIHPKIPKEIINLGRQVGGKVLRCVRIEGGMRVS
jgi:hypothetical protein